MSNALGHLQGMLGDVDNLLRHHPAATTPLRGRPPGDMRPLLRSCVVLTYAAWEVYIEDSMIEAATSIAQRCPTPDDLPAALRHFVRDSLEDPWVLAGDGWRRTVVNAVAERVRGNETTSYGINSAGPKQVINLHRDLLGEKFLDHCKWRNMPNSKIKAELAALVQVRGQIVHTGTTPGELNRDGAIAWQTFVLRLGSVLDGLIDSWLASR